MDDIGRWKEQYEGEAPDEGDRLNPEVFLQIARLLQPCSPAHRRRIVRATIALYEVDVLPIPG